MAGELLRKYQLKWFDEGVKEGLQEGLQEKLLAIAKVMLQNNLSPEMILKCTGLSSKELQELQSEVCV